MILVTGSSGRIGRAVYARLARTHRVVGFDHSPSSTADVVAGLDDTAALRRAIDGAQAVVHTAALHAPHVGHASEADFERVNVTATCTLARLCKELGVRSLVFTSTTALYGAAGWVGAATPPAPRTVYHRSKLAAEAALRAAASDTLAVTVLRMSRCFPEPAPLMAAYRLHRGIDARDVATAHERALGPSAEPFRCVVVSGATPFREDDLPRLHADAQRLIAERVPALAQAFAQRGWPLPRSIDRVYDPAPAMRAMGWHPRFGFDEVLRQFDEDSPEVLPPRDRWTANE